MVPSLELPFDYEMPEQRLTAGVDEVGRGPLAGPVLTAAVILDPDQRIDGLRDSKTLSASQRNSLALEIRAKARAWAIGRAEVAEIDHLNILQATLVAMQRAVHALRLAPELVLVDGNQRPLLACSTVSVIDGDETVDAISAASILAKVARDREMVFLDASFPGYGFSRHKGYATREHLAALDVLGPSAIHRMSFAPVRTMEILRDKAIEFPSTSLDLFDAQA